MLSNLLRPILLTLVELHVDTIEAWMLESLSAIIATSRIQGLTLVCCTFDDLNMGTVATVATLRHLRQWLNQTPVRAFQVFGWIWPEPDQTDRDSFLVALFHCPTMESLKWHFMDFTTFGFDNIVLGMPVLELSKCIFDGNDEIGNVAAFCASVGKSTQLVRLTVNAFGIYDGIVALLENVVTSNVRHLVLTYSELGGKSWWRTLAPLLTACRLETLDLSFNDVVHDDVDARAAVFENNPTLEAIEFGGDAIIVNGHSVGCSRR
ncbi:Aste57867_21354 [Aphanomyces stellatus]|uniref:Aste57867_21354 protein n=1 Tax=Aphanomyces stellatus TaxID=120398 RepID=A0A485LI03_9STRA|nr:hypothetical protein As57867_021285 [Aphanomyces stellatus]VFT98026.1 Aste57867_21354 [Aphanomyces stellatus]